MPPLKAEKTSALPRSAKASQRAAARAEIVMRSRPAGCTARRRCVNSRNKCSRARCGAECSCRSSAKVPRKAQPPRLRMPMRSAISSATARVCVDMSTVLPAAASARSRSLTARALRDRDRPSARRPPALADRAAEQWRRSTAAACRANRSPSSCRESPRARSAATRGRCGRGSTARVRPCISPANSKSSRPESFS